MEETGSQLWFSSKRSVTDRWSNFGVCVYLLIGWKKYRLNNYNIYDIWYTYIIIYKLHTIYIYIIFNIQNKQDILIQVTGETNISISGAGYTSASQQIRIWKSFGGFFSCNLIQKVKLNSFLDSLHVKRNISSLFCFNRDDYGWKSNIQHLKIRIILDNII